MNKIVIDRKENFYRVFIREFNTVEGKLDYCLNEIEFLKNWLLKLSNSKAKELYDHISDMTSPQNFQKFIGFINMSKGTRIDIKKLNTDTLNHIKTSPSMYCTYEMSQTGGILSMLSCTEFGMNKKFCKLTEHKYYTDRTSGLFKVFDSFVMLNQFDFYSEFFNICKKNKDTFQEKGIQCADMILDNKISFAATSDQKKLHAESKIYIEKYAVSGVYYEKLHIVLYVFNNAMPIKM